MSKILRIGIIAGEASGDSHAALLIRLLHSIYPDAVFEGVGGPKMQAEGCQCIYSIDDFSFIGVGYILLHLPHILQMRRRLINYFLKQKIDLFIGVDFPDFNMSIEATLKKANIKIVHYISPTIWAWRRGRIKKIKRVVDLMLSIYPFEKKFYENTNVNYQFVGHPLTRQIKGPFDVSSQRKQLGLNENGKVLALLPGSRTREIESLSNAFILTAEQCMQRYKDLQCVVALTSDTHAIQFKNIVDQVKPSSSIKIIVNKTHAVLESADVVLLSSGTATLETLLFEKPMVVAYRVDWFSYWIGHIMLYVKHISMPNILASKMLVPEYIQNDVTAENLTKSIIQYFDHPDQNTLLRKQYIKIRQSLEENIQPQEIIDALKKLIENNTNNK